MNESKTTTALTRTNRFAGRRTRLATCAALLLMAAGAEASVGAKIALQAWDPAHPEQERMVVPYDNASALSDTLAKVWNDYREPLCRRIVSELGQSNRFHAGVTLYRIDCRLQPAMNLAVRQVGPNLLEVALALRGNTIIASSTTPSVVGQYGDPRVSVDFDVDLRVQLAIQPQAARTLEVVKVFAGFSQTRLDSQNLVADVAKALNAAYAFFFGTDFRQRAEAMINGVSTASLQDSSGRAYGESLVAKANGALAPVNQALTAPANYVRIGAWFHNGKVVLAFAPRNLPAPPLTGSAEGLIRWPAHLQAQNGCGSFNITSKVQTGPSPILGPDLNLGPAPMADFGSLAILGGPQRLGDLLECRYRLSGLPVMFANHLAATPPRVNVPGQRPVSVSGSVSTPVTVVGIRPDGWTSAYALPPVNTQGWNFLAFEQTIQPNIRMMTRPAIAQAQAPAIAVPAHAGQEQRPMPAHGPIVQPAHRIVLRPATAAQQPVRIQTAGGPN